MLEERAVAQWRRDPEVPVRARGGDPTAGRALEKSRLDQVGLVEVLESAAVLTDRSGDRSDSDGTASEFFDDRRQDLPVHFVEAVLVGLETREGLAGRVEGDGLLAGDLGEVAQP